MLLLPLAHLLLLAVVAVLLVLFVAYMVISISLGWWDR